MVSEQEAKKIIRDTIARVDTKRDYNITQMTREAFFPWFADRRTYRRTVIQDTHGPNILQAKITGEGKGRDYSVTGRSIAKYLKSLGYVMVLTSKQLYGTKPTSTQNRSGERKKGSILRNSSKK